MPGTDGITCHPARPCLWHGRHPSALRLLVLVLVLTGCARGDAVVPASGYRIEPAGQGLVVPAAYRLAAGDSVRITTFGHPDASGEFKIDDDGFIKFPLLGLVEAAGRSVAELEEAIRVPLNRDFLVDPQVSVEILTFRPFYITGQVVQPGRYPFASGMTVRQAVAMAKGYTRRARTSAMIVIRETVDGTLRIRAEEDTRIRPGDTIEVQRRFF